MFSLLPNEFPDRLRLHDEVHARPVGQVPLPSVVFCLAVLNEGVTREQELAHLGELTQEPFDIDATGNFVRVPFKTGEIKWERHTEFTRYTLVQPLRDRAQDALCESPVLWLTEIRAIEQDIASWMSQIPGQTIAALEVTVLATPDQSVKSGLAFADTWFAQSAVLASWLGNQSHSLVLTDFKVQADGVERLLVLTQPETLASRVGRTVQRLIEMEIYRLMALQGLPVAKNLGVALTEAEYSLASMARDVENDNSQDHELLHQLATLAATIERAHADHSYRFSATAAYYDIVLQRIKELRETPIAGIQTIGEFMQRRLAPAMATVAATAKRLDSLSERIGRVSDLLRTRVDIVTEQQNQQLLEKLTRGQALQLKLQETVEGLSIAAISYYVVSLIYYLAKAAKTAGWLSVSPEVLTGIAIIPTVLGVWQIVRRIHRKISRSD